MKETLPALLKIYKNSILSRYLEECFLSLYHENSQLLNDGFGSHSIFSGIGTEIGPSTVTTQLSREDILIPRYRGFAAFLGKGMSLQKIVSELLQKQTGASKGIGDAAGLRDPDIGIPGYSINLGGMFGVTLGLAFAKRVKKGPGIVVQFFGDGEASRSTFGSALNLAMIWKLPILFVCENNGVSISMNIEKMSATLTIGERARGYGMPHITASDRDPLLMYENTKSAVAYVREKGLPMLFEIVEKRVSPHSSEFDSVPFLGKDIPPGDDPLEILKDVIVAHGISKSNLESITVNVRRAIDGALDAAMKEERLSEKEFFSIYHE